MSKFVRTRLAIMMFLFYFSVGSWLVTLSTFLMSAPMQGGMNFTTGEVGWIYSSMAIAGMMAPLMIGLLADRLFRADRVFAVSALGMAGLLAVAGWWCDTNSAWVQSMYQQIARDRLVAGLPVLEQQQRLAGLASTIPAAALEPLRVQVQHALAQVNNDPRVRTISAGMFFPLFAIMILVCCCVQFCLILSTVICLRNLPDPAGQFSRVRMWGTVGWVAAGNLLGIFFASISTEPIYLGAVSGTVLGLYSLTLPATPPRGSSRTLVEALGVSTLKLLTDRSFAVFLFVAFTTSLWNQFYVVYGHRFLTDLEHSEPVQLMTIAQVVEIAVMFVIPLANPRKNIKLLMAIGLCGYVARAAALYSGWEPAVLLIGVPMHGFSFAFFFVLAAIYIDREAPWHLRASAQAMVALAVSGFGPCMGNLLAAEVVGWYRMGTAIDWPEVWLVPLYGSSLIVLIFLLGFHPRQEVDRITMTSVKVETPS